MITLLDVNVLLALFDPLHEAHAVVRGWFSGSRHKVATCPLSELGFVRISSHSRYPNPLPTPSAALDLLRGLHSNRRHVFWPDLLSLADPVFAAHPFASHRETTDRYLLQLAHRHSGKLATLDRSMRPANPQEQSVLLLITAM